VSLSFFFPTGGSTGCRSMCACVCALCVCAWGCVRCFFQSVVAQGVGMYMRVCLCISCSSVCVCMCARVYAFCV